LYPYRAEEAGADSEQTKVHWSKQMPVAEKPQMESILYKRINKRTKRKEYFEYLVKWKGHPVEMPVGRMKQRFRSIDRRCKNS
jgi:hypothetical protein